jgi:hypothetical protein
MEIAGREGRDGRVGVGETGRRGDGGATEDFVFFFRKQRLRFGIELLQHLTPGASASEETKHNKHRGWGGCFEAEITITAYIRGCGRQSVRVRTSLVRQQWENGGVSQNLSGVSAGSGVCAGSCGQR